VEDDILAIQAKKKELVATALAEGGGTAVRLTEEELRSFFKR
jgi:SNF2 family DNA or RNA helicase